jgi:seryl-tRNA synthetase
MTETQPETQTGRAPYATPDDLRTALADAGVFHLTAVDGVYHRSWEWESVLRGVEAHCSSHRVVQDAPRRWFPPVMPREEFLKTDYVRSFPDLVGSIDVFAGGDKAHRALLAELEDGGDWTSHLTPGEVVLPSSVCHPLYGVLPGDVPAEGLVEECSGWSFRHEPSLDPARMQMFRIYEFVRIGTPEQALAHRDEWLERGLGALRALGLAVRSEAANDPFFGRVGRMLAANQLDQQLKYELVVDLTDVRPTAIGSSNYHEDHFGHAFGLQTPDGATAHSACIGFGLDRITLALFATHGTDLGTWPAEVRAALQC